jgi:hypothetical protein
MLENLVTELGGTFVPDFSRICTHLIAKSAVGPKVKYAFEWDIPIVKLEWIQQVYKEKGVYKTDFRMGSTGFVSI